MIFEQSAVGNEQKSRGDAVCPLFSKLRHLKTFEEEVKRLEWHSRKPRGQRSRAISQYIQPYTAAYQARTWRQLSASVHPVWKLVTSSMREARRRFAPLRLRDHGASLFKVSFVYILFRLTFHNKWAQKKMVPVSIIMKLMQKIVHKVNFQVSPGSVRNAIKKDEIFWYRLFNCRAPPLTRSRDQTSSRLFLFPK